jgi:Prealbumin-like fold domain
MFCFHVRVSTFNIRVPFDFVIIDRLWAVGVNWAMRFRRFGITLGLLLMAAFVHAGQTASGIEGVITISPIKAGPVRADAPSSRPLANAAFAVEDQKGEIASFTTDNEGRFRVSLAPGHYKVSLKGRTSSIGRYGPFEVEVVAGKMTKVQWECDSGMR